MVKSNPGLIALNEYTAHRSYPRSYYFFGSVNFERVLTSKHLTVCFQAISDIAGFRPGRRVTFLSGKGPKAIDALSGHITRVGRKPEERGPTRCAQTMPACSPVTAALLGHATANMVLPPFAETKGGRLPRRNPANT